MTKESEQKASVFVNFKEKDIDNIAGQLVYAIHRIQFYNEELSLRDLKELANVLKDLSEKRKT